MERFCNLGPVLDKMADLDVPEEQNMQTYLAGCINLNTLLKMFNVSLYIISAGFYSKLVFTQTAYKYTVHKK